MTGVLIIDKPRGWTSHDVVHRVRSVLQQRRIGHAGTLDPIATGVLVLCIGKATRIVRYLEGDDKEYHAELTLGITTDTQDAEGRVLERRSYRTPSEDAVRSVLEGFRGVIHQRPPAYSAIKVGGIPSHRLARRGSPILHPERPVTIYDIGLLEFADPVVRFRVHCSKGTYVRTLCTNIGERLGTGAHLTALTRTRAGRFSLARALPVTVLDDPAVVEQAVISLNDALPGLCLVTVDPSAAERVRHGNPVALPGETPCQAAPGASLRIVGPDGVLLAVARMGEGRVARPEVVLAE